MTDKSLELFRTNKRTDIVIVKNPFSGQEEEEAFFKLVNDVCQTTLNSRFSPQHSYTNRTALSSGSQFASKHKVYACLNTFSTERIAMKYKTVGPQAKTDEERERVFALNMYEVYFCLKVCNTNHPNIVQIRNTWARRIWNQTRLFDICIEMELCESTVCAKMRECGNSLAPALARDYTKQAFQALYFCHSNRVIHGDVKEENMLLNVSTGTVKLCDFDMARETGESGTIPLERNTNDLRHLPPEIIMGLDTMNFTVDTFAMACVLIKMLCGDASAYMDIDRQHQLDLVHTLVGPLLPAHARGMTAPDIQLPTGPVLGILDVFPRLPRDPSLLDFLSRLLEIDRGIRMSSFFALQHAYLISNK